MPDIIVDLELRKKLADGTYKIYHPITKAKNVKLTNGQDVETHLGESTTILPAGGTANAITLPIATLSNGKKYSFKATANSTGNVTINGKAFKKLDGTQIGSGGIKLGKVYDFFYDSTADCVFILAKASGNAQVGDVLAGKTFSNDDGTDLIGTCDKKYGPGDQINIFKNSYIKMLIEDKLIANGVNARGVNISDNKQYAVLCGGGGYTVFDIATATQLFNLNPYGDTDAKGDITNDGKVAFASSGNLRLTYKHSSSTYWFTSSLGAITPLDVQIDETNSLIWVIGSAEVVLFPLTTATVSNPTWKRTFPSIMSWHVDKGLKQVFVADYDGNVICVNHANSQIWSQKHRATYINKIVVTDLHVFAFYGDGYLVKMDKATGTLIWSKNLPGFTSGVYGAAYIPEDNLMYVSYNVTSGVNYSFALIDLEGNILQNNKVGYFIDQLKYENGLLYGSRTQTASLTVYIYSDKITIK